MAKVSGWLPAAAPLRALLDTIPTRVAFIDRARRHRFVNQEYASFAGLPAEQIIGRTVAELLGEATFARVRAQGERALAGEVARWEGWIEYPGSGERFVQRVYVPYVAPKGTVDGYFVFVRDLTDLKRSERELARQLQALRTSEASNSAVVAAALDCVIVVDEAGAVVEFNPAAERTFGYSRQDVLGRLIGELIVPPHLRARHSTGMQRYLTTGEAHVLGRRMELEGMRSDGSTLPVELSITEVRLPERRLFTASLRDLTEAKAAQAEIERQRQALHQNEKLAALGSLLAGVAHELNNPLSIVLGSAQMLADDVAEGAVDRLTHRATRIQEAAERCARVVRTFLAMARQRQTERRWVGLAPLAASLVDLLGYGLRTGGVEVTIDLPPDLPPVWADADQLHQVLLNLLVNAQQSLAARPPPRRVTITASHDAAAHEVALVVADNGPGVSPDIRHRIFEPFFTTKPVGMGTGIGLSVSRGLVEAHGGRLELGETPAAGGGCFVLRLPLDGPGVPPLDPAPPASAVGARAMSRRALIVDDEPEVAGLLAELLGRLGFVCDLAADGGMAQELAAARDYDAVLCDLRMPGIDGEGFFRWLAVHRPALLPRLAFVTGDTLGSAARRFLESCRRPVLEKPFRPRDVQRLIETLQHSAGDGTPRND